MLMDDQEESQNVEDVRGSGGGFRPIHGIGLGTIAIALIGVWSTAFQQSGRAYENPKLRLFRDSYPTACGQGQAAAGPFYCPNDRIVYLDLGFFDLMTQQLNAPGQFAHAYVIGHEVGHHVQNLLGIIDTVDAQRERGSEAQSNALSVRLELQADCLAGVWATRSQKEKGWRL